ncbi:MAG: bifunctional folylpolyglutamate synthase/dihydrofolate synthase [Candidatus Kryptoniota bacterium]
MSFEAAKKFLFTLEKFGMKMDLQNIDALMEYAGNPHDGLQVIHVAGTNGKGSTCAMVASVLTSMGYKVGLYTSPHIISVTERIKIGGEPISEENIENLTEFFEPEIVKLRATFFEAITAMMFKYFADRKVDYAVIETGMGGRLDSTNIVDPLISIITGIGFDHTEILGNTLEKIAFEKAGIFKPNKPAAVNVKAESVKEVFRKVGLQKGAPVVFVDEVAKHSGAVIDIESSTVEADVSGISYPGLRVGLGGEHQIQNALTALTALNLLSRSKVGISRNAIYEGLDRITSNTAHRGRLEIISQNPFVIVDVAHNPDGINAVIRGLTPLNGREGVLLFAAMRDKDARSMLNSLRERFGTVILTSLQSGRSMNAEDLKKLSDSIKLSSQIFDDSSEALRVALSQSNNDNFLLITGSHYLAGETMPLLDNSMLNLVPPNYIANK